MTITNEPGYYEDGAFGIRIENQMVVKEVKTEHNFGNTKFYGFENLTLAPIQTKVFYINNNNNFFLNSPFAFLLKKKKKKDG